MKIELSYFKLSGKWHSAPEEAVDFGLGTLHANFEYVRVILRARVLPGLTSGHDPHIVLITDPVSGLLQLVFPDGFGEEA